MDPTDAEISDRLRAILRSDEFQPSLSDRLWLAIRGSLDWLAGMGPAVRALVIGACLLVLLAIATVLWRFYLEAAATQRQGSTGKTGRHDEKPLSPQALLAKSRTLEEQGLLRDAARALQHALLLQLCLEREVPWRLSLSDWEWVRIFEPSESVVDFTRATQRLAFGPEPNRADFAVCAQQVHAWIADRPPDMKRQRVALEKP
jgi:hypothetical protein